MQNSNYHNLANRRSQMAHKKHEFLKALAREAEENSQSCDCEPHQSMPEQDQRLTSKHIKTLTFLQDIVNENKRLKARIEELENEMSKCGELHKLARDSREQMKQIERQYLERTEQINTMLLEKHKTELLRVVQEKVELERNWLLQKKDLEIENEQLKASVAQLNSSLSLTRQDEDKAQMVTLKLDALSEENTLLKAEHSRLTQENKNLRAEIESAQRTRQQNDKLTQDLTQSRQQLTELQLRVDQLQRNSDGDTGDKGHLMDILKNKLTKLTNERRLLTDRCSHHEDEISNLRVLLQDATERLHGFDLIRERLEAELAALRQELSKRKPPTGDRNFKEFVSLKRELVSLKERNEDLAVRARPRGRSQSSVLPVLKASDTGLVVAERRVSAGSVGAGKRP